MFSGVSHERLVFAANFYQSDVVLYPALLAPQAWTLGVELTFYLLAPFVLQRKKIMLLCLTLSVGARIYLFHLGLGAKDPWTYRFFPTELALFLLGALAHQVLMPMYKKLLSTEELSRYASAATYFLVCVTLTFSNIPLNGAIKTIALFTLFLVSLPLSFWFQAERKWDKWIGDLSYPIYISHMFVIYLADWLLKTLHGDSVGSEDHSPMLGIGVVIGSICFAVLLNRFIGAPVESLRRRFKTRTIPPQSPSFR